MSHAPAGRVALPLTVDSEQGSGARCAGGARPGRMESRARADACARGSAFEQIQLAGLALPADCVYFGEVSLSGAIRPVAHTAQRLKEAEKLGFSQAVLPSASTELPKNGNGRWSEMESLPDLVARIAGSRHALRPAEEAD